MIQTPRTGLAMALLGVVEADFSAEPPASNNPLLTEKHSRLKAEFTRLRQSLTDKDISGFVVFQQASGTRSEEGKLPRGSDGIERLLAQEKARVANIVKRDQARVAQFKEQMKENVRQMVRGEMQRKQLDKDRKAQALKFTDKMNILKASRAKLAQEHELNGLKKREAKAQLMRQMEEKAQLVKTELLESIKSKLAAVARKRDAYRESKKLEALEYCKRLDGVHAHVRAMDLRATREAEGLVQHQQTREEEIKQRRQLLIAAWVRRAREHGERFAKRIEAKAALYAKDFEKREFVAANTEKEFLSVRARIAENRRLLRESQKLRMQKMRELTMKTVERGHETHAAKQAKRSSEYDAKHVAVARIGKKETLLKSQVDDFRNRRHRLKEVVGGNRVRLTRKRKFDLDRRIAKIRNINAKVEKLKDLDAIRKERQKLLRLNFVEKAKISRFIRKVQSTTNEARFAAVAKKLGIVGERDIITR